MSHDPTRLLDNLAHVLQQRDPMPTGLPDRILVALGAGDLDAEYELLMRSRPQLSAATRTTSTAGLLTVEFRHEEVRFVLRISPLPGDRRRLDGWLVPPRPATVTLTGADRSWTAEAGTTGHVEFTDLPSTTVWLLLDLPPHHHDSVAQPALRLRTTAFEI